VINGASSAAGMDLELSQFVDMVFSKVATARHFCRKLYTYFVRSKITAEIEQNVIIPLADELLANQYEILPTVRRLLQSRHFYDQDDSNPVDEILGGMVKSPLQQISEFCTYLGCTIPNPGSSQLDYYSTFWNNFVHNAFMAYANMMVFDPDNVAGHPPYYQGPDLDRLWISSSTLIARYRLGESLLDGKNRIGNNGNIVGIIKIAEVIRNNGLVANALNAQDLCRDLCKGLFGLEPDTNRVAHFKTSFLLQGWDDSYWSTAWSNYISTYDSSVVEPRLKLLVKKLLNAPEAQLF
jgi:hypothetical protein